MFIVRNYAPDGKRVAFASCKDPTYDGGGTILSGSTHYEFSAQPM